MKKITSLKSLIRAARDGRAVVVPQSMCLPRPCPAAFVQNFNGVEIQKLFDKGMYLYEGKTR